MFLETGKSAKCHFIRFMKKTNIFEWADHAVVAEREKGKIYIYATNDTCSEIYGILNLGSDKFLRKYKVVIISYNDHVMLVDAGIALIVIDFDAKKVAVNNPDVVVKGSKAWGPDIQEPWLDDYNAMFGLDA